MQKGRKYHLQHSCINLWKTISLAECNKVVSDIFGKIEFFDEISKYGFKVHNFQNKCW